MKKLLSMMLTLVLVLGMSTAAFAADGDTDAAATWDGTYTPTAETEFNEIVKTYDSENNVVVNETLSFTSEAKTTNPDVGAANLTVDDLAVSSLNPGKLKVTIPSLSKAGVYEWTIKETAGSTAGVTYSTAEVHVIVLVQYNNNTHALEIANTESYIKQESGVKAKTFTNTFKSGSFTVAKAVTGNMANENDEFGITVTLTSSKPIGTNISVAGTTVAPSAWAEDNGTYTYTFTTNYSKIGGAKTFSDIPEGVTVSVVENNTDNMNGYAYVSTNENTDNTFSMTVADTDDNTAVVVTNNKGQEIATGIGLDSLPYILMLAIACAGLFVFISKKRMMREN